jgi:hypothetical protein
MTILSAGSADLLGGLAVRLPNSEQTHIDLPPSVS